MILIYLLVLKRERVCVEFSHDLEMTWRAISNGEAAGLCHTSDSFQGEQNLRVWSEMFTQKHYEHLQKALFCVGEVRLSFWVCDLISKHKNFFLQVDTIQILWKLFSYKVRMELCVVKLLLSMDLILVSHFE